jgi:hypothetical protein
LSYSNVLIGQKQLSVSRLLANPSRKEGDTPIKPALLVRQFGVLRVWEEAFCRRLTYPAPRLTLFLPSPYD